MTSKEELADARPYRPPSLVDHVADRIREQILVGAIRPGERIRIPELEQRLGVSHIPIREALRRLETEGLVVLSPRKGAVVAEVSLEDLAALYDLRRMIECEIARRAVDQMTETDLAAIREKLADLERAAHDPALSEFFHRDREFHWAILAPGGTDWVRRVVSQLWQESERYVRLFVWTFGGSVAGAMLEHRALLKACEARDADALVTRLVEHLSRTEETIRAGFLENQAHAPDVKI